ncbi:hypothetical protein [Actinoplanes sp. N902-109]|uniref:hypothetical protein n=1 Tax=Actinoplanes sp. (strain N902-109) TaxID=649831 RepID=UPI0003295A15|nr:hypothetical protein [Actinoplanes sp. N902-109]AGL20322.1 hypothetical protein L083_6812 [Actinoplanes sp. N902-109]
MRRRQLLGGVAGTAGLAALAGCGLFDHDPEPAPAPDALQPVLDEAVALAAAYDRAAVNNPDLAAFAQDHHAHATELAKLIGATLPSAAASAPVAGDDSAALRKAEQAAQKTAAAACKAAPAERAAIVGSIAAARAAHAEALR